MIEDFLQQLRRVNSARSKAWFNDAKYDTALYDATELGGEVGEVLNDVKKLEREKLGIVGSRSSVAKLASEIADVLICLDRIAAYHNIDLAVATADKFNETSEKNGFRFELKAPAYPADRCQICGVLAVGDVPHVQRVHRDYEQERIDDQLA